MASFFTSLLVAQFLVALLNSAAPSSGSSNKIAGALTNNSALQGQILVKNNGSAILSELERSRKPQQSAAPSRAHSGAPLTPRGADTEVHQLRLEMIKAQILKKLHMDKEPKYVARPDVSLPEPLADFSIDNNKSGKTAAEYSQRKQVEVIVMAEKDSTSPVTNGQSGVPQKLSLKFRLTEKVYTNAISSAFLWIRKRQNSSLGGHNVRIYNPEGPSGNTTRRFVRTKIKSKGAWLIISLKKVVRDWVKRDRSENAPKSVSFLHTLEVSCTNCNAHANGLLATRGKFRPFLVVDISSQNGEEAPRRKRSIECQPTTKDCCKESFYVSFQALNWSNWIVQPRGFYANYCKGSCKGAFATKYHHTFIMRKLSVYQSQLEPCCSPTKLSGLSMLYFETNGSNVGTQLLKRDLPDMRVEECGCT